MTDTSYRVEIGLAHNRPYCYKCKDILSMYFCHIHNEFYCTNCQVDHP